MNAGSPAAAVGDSEPAGRRARRRTATGPRRTGWTLALVTALSLAGCQMADDDDADTGDARTLEVAGAEVTASFDEDPGCFGIEPAGLDVDEVECGTVEAPLDYAEPDGDTLDLAVATLPGSEADAHERPLLLLGGGPGEVMVETLLTQPQARQLFDVGPDLVVMDQRGVGVSDPSLECPQAPEVESQETAAADVDAYLDALTDCRARLADEGVDLDAFNHVANADDVALVRAALGHDRIDVRGGSYGSHLAVHTAERHPDGIRSLILSSPVDPSRNFVGGLAPGFEQALGRVAAACARDLSCAGGVGDLEAAIAETAQRLDAQPAEVTVQPAGSESTTTTYDATTFLNGLFLLFYLPDGVAALPAIVDRARDGDLEPLGEIVALVEQQLEDGVAIGMQLSMVCSGEGAHFDAGASLAELDSELLAEHWFPYNVLGGEATPATCDAWDVEPTFDPEAFSLSVDVPALIVTGAFDHVTPPGLGERLDEALPTSHLVEVPTAGHGPLEALSLEACGQQLVADFLADPRARPDTSCATDRQLQLMTDLPDQR